MSDDLIASLVERVEALAAQVDEVFERVPFGSFSVDNQGLCTSINAMALSWLGCERADLIGKQRPVDFFAPSGRQQLESLDRSILGGRTRFDLDLVTRSGTTRTVAAHFISLALDRDGPRRHRALLFDETSRRQKQIGQRMAALAFESPCGICIMDATGCITQVNQAFIALTGFTLNELRGNRLHMLDAVPDGSDALAAIWPELVQAGVWQGEVHFLRKDCRALFAWLDISSISNPDGAVRYYVASVHDITTHTVTRQEIHRLAFFDPLTQLPNRRLLLERLSRMLGTCVVTGQLGALMFIDIDNFKVINDTRGHAIGDQLLVEVARRLRMLCRSCDTVARLGGDEFVVLIANLGEVEPTAAARADKIGHKVLHALAGSYRFEDFSFSTSASMGVSLIDGKSSVSELLQQSDLAMYEAKRAGRNALRRFDPSMKTTADENAAIKQELWQALELGEFELYYQPQFDADWHVLAAEALLRWNHPIRGVLAPAAFIDAAELSGLIVPIGQWVVESACRQLSAWAGSAATRHIDIAVNVSARQFGETDFVDHYRRSQAMTGADPHRLVMELTETTVHDVGDIRAKMLPLREMGVRFSLDDFGIGHSSLARLIGLPISQIKIDRSFVQHMTRTTAATVVVKTIIGMAHSLGVEVIAEGVETTDQLNELHASGCPMFQGYLMSPPVRVGDFERLGLTGRQAQEAAWSA